MQFARHAGLNESDAEEVTQEVFKSVAQGIDAFESRPQHGTFKAWLFQLTRWRINDHFRRQGRQLPSAERASEQETGTRTEEKIPAPQNLDEAWEKDWQRNLLRLAMSQIAGEIDAKHFQIFQLYNEQEWSALQISRDMRVQLPTVYVVNHRVTKLLKARIKHLGDDLG